MSATINGIPTNAYARVAMQMVNSMRSAFRAGWLAGRNDELDVNDPVLAAALADYLRTSGVAPEYLHEDER